MALIDYDAAMQDLSPYLDGVSKVVRDAWTRANTGPSIDLIDKTKTTRAGEMRDFAVGDLQRFWVRFSEIGYGDYSQQGLFVIRLPVKTYSVRVKKLDRGSCSRNHRSEQDENYRGQGEIVELGIVHNMELGYVLNREETEIADVRILCLNGDRPYWWQSIESAAGGVIDLFEGERDPQNPDPQIGPATGVIIKPKGEYEA